MKSNLIKLLSAFVMMVGTATPVDAQLTPLTISRIKGGDSIVIYYDVTINTGCACMQISNQGTITGSNFSNMVTDDPATTDPNDPTITFLNMDALPVKLLEFKAHLVQGTVKLSWTVTHEDNFMGYAVERSSDGRNFSVIGFIAGRNSITVTSYSISDLHPFTGNNFYRLKMIDRDGTYEYSAVAWVNMSSIERGITVYPNPVTQASLTMRFADMGKGYYDISLYSSTGQVVYQKQIYHDGGSATRTMSLPSNIGKGIYRLVSKTSEKIIVQSIVIQ